MLDFEFRPERDNKIYIENEATLEPSKSHLSSNDCTASVMQMISYVCTYIQLEG